MAGPVLLPPNLPVLGQLFHKYFTLQFAMQASDLKPVVWPFLSLTALSTTAHINQWELFSWKTGVLKQALVI